MSIEFTPHESDALQALIGQALDNSHDGIQAGYFPLASLLGETETDEHEESLAQMFEGIAARLAQS